MIATIILIIIWNFWFIYLFDFKPLNEPKGIKTRGIKCYITHGISDLNC